MKHIKSNSGFSAVEAVVAAAMLAGLVSLSASAIVEAKRAEARSSLSYEIQVAHSSSMQQSRSITYIREQLGLPVTKPTSETKGSDGTQDTGGTGGNGGGDTVVEAGGDNKDVGEGKDEGDGSGENEDQKSAGVDEGQQIEVENANLVSQSAPAADGSQTYTYRSYASVTESVQLTADQQALVDCFSRRRPKDGCSRFASAHKSFDKVSEPSQNCGSDSCQFDSNITYSVVCDDSSCSHVEIDVKTEETGGHFGMKTLSAKGSVPGILFAEKQKVDYSCASNGGIIGGIDSVQGAADCTPATGQVTCADKSPLVQYVPNDGSSKSSAPCARAESTNCANAAAAGVGSVGFFEKTSTCVFNASVASK